ncbi:prenyltransferase [Tepidimonas charontis]|uniref:1,4-dihydroxy-2-naphthoate octaprenyltransferase n=1 Tax=Tepidimonas charontis TaxID=2267262 RepID=A0A554XD55_9BURK|nr:prenyltransferase [Tepidimonas charontis]TSE33684.1 1,4-dihydroxy-2-naphthoate octaprenyltransferase [Tepidimonas charontis]
MTSRASNLSLDAAWRLMRPGFLTLTAAAVALGLSMAAACGCGFDPLRAGVTLVLALAAHAAANAWNDYHDALSGADARNPAPLSPFTGGSRVIQQGAARPEDAQRLAVGLTVWVVLGGVWLALQAGATLLWVGLAGLALGWAYSAPPLRLMARGLGEVAVATAWWLIVQGAQVAQRGQWSLIAAVSALPFALLVANILLINGLPDAPWDAQVSKRTLAVRLGPVASAALYSGLAVGAHVGLAAAVWAQIPPGTAWWGLVSAPLSLLAAALLWRHVIRRQPTSALRPAIGLTIAAAIVHALALAAAFAAVAAQR